MFSLSVIEHVRLNFGLLVQNYTVHARAAERLAGFGLKAKIAVLTLFAIAAGAMVLSLFRAGRSYQIAAAVIACVALAVQVLSVAFGLETRVHAHRSVAHRLWLMCERYRSLLTEIQDGLVDDAAILQRRDVLSDQVHAIYGQEFSADQQAYERLRQPPLQSEIATEEQIEQLLPASARKAS